MRPENPHRRNIRLTGICLRIKYNILKFLINLTLSIRRTYELYNRNDPGSAVPAQVPGLRSDHYAKRKSDLPGCIRKLSWVRGPVCKCCGKEIISETAEYCSDCAIHPRSFSNGMALLNYNEISAPSWQRSSITTIGNIWIFMQSCI